MQLNLRQIEVFRAIMLTGSISGAAQLLHVSQPAVSRLISHTETRLGLRLFERIKSRLYPTPEAQRLFTEVESVYRGVQRVNTLAADLIEKRTGSLRIACSPSLAYTLVPLAVSRFGKRFPDVRVHLDTLVAAPLVEAIVTQQVELAVSLVPVDHPNIEVQPLYEDHMVAILHATHPLADRAVLDVADLERERLIGYGADTPLGVVVGRMFRKRGREPRLAAEVRLTHIACAMVQAGVGVALVDELSVIGRVWPDIVVREVTPSAMLKVVIAHSRFQPLSRLAQEFVATFTGLQYKSLRLTP